jgi:outer membrane protein assembly factor BamB
MSYERRRAALMRGGGTVLRVALLAAICNVCLAQSDWPRFRGPRFDNTFPGERPPAEFGPDKNLKWKVSVPSGHSSPILVGDRIVVTSFDGDATLETIALSKATGAVLWRQPVRPAQLETYIAQYNNPAASTCASDGERIVTYFGSYGLICYSVAGEELWRRPMPLPESRDGFGTGTSPIVHDGKVILVRDEDGPGQGIYALDIRTGKDLWFRKRDGFRISFGSPVVWDSCVVAAGDLRLKAYDLESGADRWVVNGLAACPCTTPTPGADGNLYVAVWSNGSGNEPNMPPWEKLLEAMDQDRDGKLSPSDCKGSIFGDLFSVNDQNHDGFIDADEWNRNIARMLEGKNAVLSIRPGGQGDITDTHVVWRNDKGAPYVASPLVDDGLLYLIKDGGMLTVYEAASGEVLVDRQRLGVQGDFYASPISVDERVFVISRNGVFVCLAAGKAPSVLWEFDLGESTVATPIVSDNTVFVRSQDHLWAFGEN